MILAPAVMDERDRVAVVGRHGELLGWYRRLTTPPQPEDEERIKAWAEEARLDRSEFVIDGASEKLESQLQPNTLFPKDLFLLIDLDGVPSGLIVLRLDYLNFAYVSKARRGSGLVVEAIVAVAIATGVHLKVDPSFSKSGARLWARVCLRAGWEA